MITVTIHPYDAPDEALKKIQTRYPNAYVNTSKQREVGRFALDLPSKNANNWTQQDADFFNVLTDQDHVLVGWAILGGTRGRDFTGQH